MMRLLRTGVITALISTIISAPTLAATLTPAQQVQQAVDWFTGFFTNQAQVNSAPNVPLLTMENCAVPTSSTTTSRYVHLEQFFGGTGSLLRTRAYEFSPGATGVDLSIFSYRNLGTALGTCDQATAILDLSDLLTPSCDLTLTYREDEFFGTNIPTGCPTSFPVPGSTVVSTVTIAANTVDSTDTFLLPSGGAIGTPITFNRVSTPEPTLIVGIIAVGLLATAGYKRT